jgi:AcrR family transcriptional regulator
MPKPVRSRREQEHEREQVMLRAALTELALFDYGGMTIEDVARRAGVNKTTVYRKWPTKSALVQAALTSVFELFSIGPSAGDLRSDLRKVARQLIAFTLSPEGKSLLRLRLLQQPEPELAEIAKQLRARTMKQLMELIEPAVARGEIAKGVDIKLLLDMLWGVLFAKLVFNMETIDNAMLERILDMLLTAARQPAPEGRRSSTKAKTKVR